MKRLRVLFLFYQNFVVASTVIDVIGCGMLLEYGKAVWMPVLWMKLGTSPLLGIWFHFLSGYQLYFYYNLGFSQRFLYCSVFLIDFSIAILAFLIALSL